MEGANITTINFDGLVFQSNVKCAIQKYFSFTMRKSATKSIAQGNVGIRSNLLRSEASTGHWVCCITLNTITSIWATIGLVPPTYPKDVVERESCAVRLRWALRWSDGVKQGLFVHNYKEARRTGWNTNCIDPDSKAWRFPNSFTSITRWVMRRGWSFRKVNKGEPCRLMWAGVGENPPCVVAVWGYSVVMKVCPSRPSYSQHSLTRCPYFLCGSLAQTGSASGF